MKHPIDLEHWNRKEHFRFFGSMDDPFFGLTTQIDVTSIYKEAKTDHASFFLYSLHKIMTAVNEVEEFRYRIIDNIPVCFDRIHVGTTRGREDGTVGFGFIEYTPDRQLFLQNAQKEIERVQALTGLCKDRESDRQDLVRFSPVPWIAFTEMKHASSFRTGDSATRISTGKLIEQNGHRMLPISVTAHHGLMDGRHVSILLDRIADKDG